MKRQLSVLALVILGGCGWVASLARGEPGWHVITDHPDKFGLAATRVDMHTRDGLRIAGWWLPASPDHPGKATVILVHGRGSNRGEMLPRAKFLVAAGYDALAIDLRAHGDSEGAYLSPGYLEVNDIDAAIELARRKSPRPVVLLGHSVGGVAVLHTTSRGAPVAGTIADSAFVSAFDMLDRVRERMARRGAPLGARIGLWFASSRSLAGVVAQMMKWGGADEIDARRGDLMPVLPKITAPVLFISGLTDEIAPTVDAQRMIASVSSHGTRIVELATGHQTYQSAPAEYERAVLRFLQLVVPQPPAVVGGAPAP